ncbi:hypothetical protein J0X19_13850 [Hymenobacter sp. BT186]|uniref:DUF4177 domain-containing protein n=1 Tax=Hymenobacter telluris TaxID=2816474 RepID=A0A939JDL7_9BACT|nr:hypothetical protein [Hymenobacter telluris]MBO0359038.1 hypothetical protein [Hymenobacter telluris]MBW3375064.1 hypothetical protein [Hymenobacter norwichensis]
MKSLFLAIVLTGAALTAQAQQPVAGSSAIKRTEEYCQVQSWAKLNGKFVVAIDYGQERKLLSANVYRDAAGQPIEFNSVIDALNWLNSQGWELVNGYGEGTTNTFVMRRRLPS